MIDTQKLSTEKIPLSDLSYFSSTFLDYLEQNPKLNDFAGAFPTPEVFQKLIQERGFPSGNRTSLVKVLNEQYKGLVLSGKLIQNISSLKNENCYSITTGHQLNIFTGPLFFIYKIISTINTCLVLKKHYPQFEFVPVYWMASEDHDFAEINHFHLFGKEYRWDSEQTGAVGRFNLEGISEIVEEIKDCPEFFVDAYGKSRTLSEATRRIVNHLFGDYGLVVLDADNPILKETFSPIIRDEIINHNTFQKVLNSTESLRINGYKTLVSPREINLFYLKDDIRERIVKKGEKYEILGTDLSFTQQQLLEEVDQYPERFSPNVVMRTLYQETILPNLAYIGGPGELSYWLQFKSSFDYYNIPFPVLLPRNNVLFINKSNTKKKNKLGLSTKDLFLVSNDLRSTFVERNASSALDLESERDSIKETFEAIFDKVKAIDGSLIGYVKAEENKALKNLEQIEKRLKKAEESKQEMTVKQLMGLKDKLFPDGSLQERHQNFLNFYINNPGFIEDLMPHLDPFDFNFHVLLEDG